MTTDPDPTGLIREHALRLLDRRAYSRGELADRLVAKGRDHGLVDHVVRRLADSGLIDDEAYARALAEATVEKKPASAALIRQRLQARRIPDDIAERVVTQVLAGVDPVEAAGSLARHMLRTGRGRSARSDLKRIGAALSRRGFDPDIICEALERAGLPLPDESLDQEHES